MAASTRTVKLIKKAARELHKGMKPGGYHSTKKGKAGYSRKEKHGGKTRANPCDD